MAAERRRRLSGKGSELRLALSDVAYAMVGTLGHIGEAQVNRSERATTATTSTLPSRVSSTKTWYTRW